MEFIVTEDILLEPDCVICCTPVFVFRDSDKPRAFLCQSRRLDEVESRPFTITNCEPRDSDEKFNAPVFSAWCGKLLRYSTGFPYAGVSHGMCEKCYADQAQKYSI